MIEIRSKREVTREVREVKRVSGKGKREIVCMCARLLAVFFIVSSYGARAFGSDLFLPTGGRVTVEFISSSADHTNTLSVIWAYGLSSVSVLSTYQKTWRWTTTEKK